MFEGPKRLWHIGSQAIEANMSSWVKEKKTGFWDIKGKEDNLQEDGKNKHLVNKCLQCHADLGKSSLPQSTTSSS